MKSEFIRVSIGGGRIDSRPWKDLWVQSLPLLGKEWKQEDGGGSHMGLFGHWKSQGNFIIARLKMV